MKPTRRMLTAVAAAAMFAFNAAPALGLNTISGYAYGEQVTTTLLNNSVVATSGPLPTAGPFDQSTPFSASNTALNVTVTGLLTTGLLSAETAGNPSTGVNSQADVATVNALTGLFTADAVSARCDVNAAGDTSGFSTLVNAQLKLDGITPTTLAANPGPNTVVAFSSALASGTATLNEQFYDATANKITVNAVHLHVTSGTLLPTGALFIDIIISHVECDASPAGATPVIPEAPLALLLPLTAAAILGAALFVARRPASLSGMAR